MCLIQLKVIKIYVTDPQKKERADMEKKEQGMEVGDCGLNGAMKSSTRTQSIEH